LLVFDDIEFVVVTRSSLYMSSGLIVDALSIDATLLSLSCFWEGDSDVLLPDDLIDEPLALDCVSERD